MGDVKVAKDLLNKAIEDMKAGNIDAQEFYKRLMEVLSQLDVTNDDLKGTIPHLLGFVNGLIRNLEK